jgi:16S rRNA (guanine527-N7)-methyltransferase
MPKSKPAREIAPDDIEVDAGLAAALETLLPETEPVPGPPEAFSSALSELHVELDPGDAERLARYIGMLRRGNALMNLTAPCDDEAMWTRHVLDALTLLPLLGELPEGAKIIDVGSGGGLPGLPLAIAMPGAAFTLLEATGKKAAFLREAARVLGLSNVRVVQGRAESAGQDHREHREAYDGVVSRAVGRVAMLAELTVPFMRPGGLTLLIKGQKADEEIAEAARAFEMLLCTHAGTVDTPTGRVVVLTKHSRTPRDYPRRDGEPKRMPLGTRPASSRPVREASGDSDGA